MAAASAVGAAAPVLEYQPPQTPALGERTARGVLWTVLQSLSSKLISIVGQVVLAWLLIRKDFGQVGLALAIYGFASILQQSGLREILIQRHRHFQRWENPAFWMSLAFGVFPAIAMVALAPLAASVFGSPGLTGLLAVLALTAPFNSLAVVPTARIQAELRFRLLSILNVVCSIVTVLLSVLLAYLGFGAYSLVIPIPIIAALRAGVLLWSDPPKIRPALQLRRWRYLLRDSGLIIATVACIMVSMQGDYLTLGYRHGDEVVGVYFFAFNLSAQTMQLLAVNIAGVLLPALSKLQREPQRQCQAFIRASRLVALVGIPFCFLQAAVAEPVFAVFFDAKWQASVPVFQVLSIGMGSSAASINAGSMMQAQGQFMRLFLVSLAFAVLFAIGVTIGAWVGQALAVATAVAIYAWVTGPLNIFFSIRPTGGGLREVCRVYAVPLLVALPAVGLPYLVSRQLPQMAGRHWVQMFTIGALMLVIYVPLLRLLAPADWNELVERVRGLLRRRAAA